MRLTLFLFLALSLLSAESMLTRTRVLMGTYASLTLPSNANIYASKTFEKIAILEHSLSTFDTEASLYRLNHTHIPIEDATLAQALRQAKTYYRDTNGYFDVTIGSITKTLYHFGETHPASPTKEALAHAKRNIEGIHIEGSTVRSDKDIIIDLGGMGKGFAVDSAANFLLEHNITRGRIALSGDIRCIGLCEIAIQSPFSDTTFATAHSLVNDLSVSTSGTYRRYATKPSEHHLIDPKTASQEKNFVSVTLFAQADNSMIDAYATAVSVMPKAEALLFLKQHPNTGYILVEPNGKIIDGNWKKLVHLEWHFGTLLKR